MTDQATPSRFLALPRELRDEIYQYTFSDAIWVNLGDIDIRTRNAGLLAACKQTRREALALYYQTTEFKVDEPVWCQTTDSVKFLASIATEHRHLITVVNINFWSYGEEDRDKIYSRRHETKAEYFARRRRDKDAMLRFIKGKLVEEGISVKDGVLKTMVLAWNGERNEGILTATPSDEASPRYDEVE
ncbi:hypothetical protein PRZ48_014686 [Zasmidium cellare]|uniref:F-box domain-containing protein n=1 Tax=Zasmidium cellare TaxID=395010 RepID=A0ABR0DYY4_ZASCE|nr:hypothetical protein PRZ48_014686 [Zasmidium cellare]